MGLMDKTLWGEGGFEARIPELEESLGESIKEAWNANHLQGRRQVGGKLMLTDSRLVFYPSKLERGKALNAIRILTAVTPDPGGPSHRVFQSEGAFWAAELDAIEVVGSTWMIRSYLRLTLEDGSREEFLLNRLKKEVIPRIREAVEAAPAATE